MHSPPPETLEINAQGREDLVLDAALPVLAAWRTSVRVTGFRPTMGVSGLFPTEVARLRTLGLATGARATGLFEGANDFRIGFSPSFAAAAAQASFGVDADLSGHAVVPVVADLMVASFGLAPGRRMNHRLHGLTHPRGSTSHGYGARTLERLGRALALNLEVDFEELGFEPQGVGRVAISAAMDSRPLNRELDWKDRGDLRSVRVRLGGVRPRAEQLDLLEAALKETWWEAQRLEPVVERVVTPGVDPGAFLQMDLEFERGGATFVDLISKASAPLAQARRITRRAQAYLDSSATCDNVTGIQVLTAAVAARIRFEMALVPSARLSGVCALLRDLGARVEEKEAPGLVLLKTH